MVHVKWYYLILKFFFHVNKALQSFPTNKQIAPFFKQLSTKYPDAVFLKVDVDKCPGTAAANSVSAMPTFVFIRRHAEIDRMKGANKDQLEEKVKKNYAPSGGAQEQGTSGDSNGASVGVEGDFVKNMLKFNNIFLVTNMIKVKK